MLCDVYDAVKAIPVVKLQMARVAPRVCACGVVVLFSGSSSFFEVSNIATGNP